MPRPIRSYAYFVRKHGPMAGIYSRATYITGLTTAVKKFQKIARTYDGRGFSELEQALYEGAQMIQASAKANVHSRSGGLARSIVAKKFTHKRRNAPAAFVALHRSRDCWWGHLVEYGTAPRYHKKTGKFVGAMPAKPFMRPAVDANRWNVIARVRSKMSELVKRAAA